MIEINRLSSKTIEYYEAIVGDNKQIKIEIELHIYNVKHIDVLYSISYINSDLVISNVLRNFKNRNGALKEAKRAIERNIEQNYIIIR